METTRGWVLDVLWFWCGNGNENLNVSFGFGLDWKSQVGGWWICYGFGMEVVMKTFVFRVVLKWKSQVGGGGCAMALVLKWQ